ncbi:hypothetical protein E2542_SST04506 [Spatholobus suberectus]|nr:hypothetical protein E2542_SST04506 [Spatholobus suberectus]
MDVNRWRTSEFDEVKEGVGTCGNVADDGKSRRSSATQRRPWTLIWAAEGRHP